jgi:hypothetical protein
VIPCCISGISAATECCFALIRFPTSVGLICDFVLSYCSLSAVTTYNCKISARIVYYVAIPKHHSSNFLLLPSIEFPLVTRLRYVVGLLFLFYTPKFEPISIFFPFCLNPAPRTPFDNCTAQSRTRRKG